MQSVLTYQYSFLESDQLDWKTESNLFEKKNYSKFEKLTTLLLTENKEMVNDE